MYNIDTCTKTCAQLSGVLAKCHLQYPQFYCRELEAHIEGRRDRDKWADILIKVATNLYLQFQNVSPVFPTGI